MELIEAIADVREWRFGPDEPPWLLPTWLSAVQLGLMTGQIEMA
jgi:hypothetical protein